MIDLAALGRQLSLPEHEHHGPWTADRRVMGHPGLAGERTVHVVVERGLHDGGS